MKKKLFVLLVILAVVLTGVFADDPFVDSGSSEIILKGVIGADFAHGLKDGSSLKSEETIENALAEAGVSFDYAYRSNQADSAKIYMKITDFTSGSNTIKLMTVKVGETSKSSSDIIEGKGIKIVDGIQVTGSGLNSVMIKIVAAQEDTDLGLDGVAVGNKKSVASAEAGTYTAILTFSVLAD